MADQPTSSATPNETTPPATPKERFYSEVLELASGSVSRSRSGAEFVEKAAVAIAGLYTGILGVAFSVSDNPLPLRGVIPAVFLGLAVAGAAYYLAYPVRPRTMDTPDDEGLPPEDEAWFDTFTVLTSNMAFRRGWALRAGIVALAFGAIFLPAPFLGVKTDPPQPPTVANWPEFPSVNLPLQRILFLEQVKEAARLRREGRPIPAGAWPEVPTANPPLERILFTEQVREVARLRREAKPIPVGQLKVRERWVWWSAGVGLALVALTAISTPILGWRIRGHTVWPAVAALAVLAAAVVALFLTPALSWIKDLG